MTIHYARAKASGVIGYSADDLSVAFIDTRPPARVVFVMYHGGMANPLDSRKQMTNQSAIAEQRRQMALMKSGGISAVLLDK